MKLRRLRKKLRKQIKRERLAGQELDAVNAVLNNEQALIALNERIEAEVNPWNQQGLIRGAQDGWDWKTWLANVWDWFVANWPTILKIIITIAPLLLLEPKRENS